MYLSKCLHTCACVLACGALIAALPAALADDREVHFENHVRPFLERYCIECHSGQDPKGDVRLSDREGWMESGAIEPGKPDASLLIQVLRSTDPDTVMPPPDTGKVVSTEAIDRIEQWIATGAFDPRTPVASDGLATSGPKKRNRIFTITPEDISYWAFQPLPASVTKPLETVEISESINAATQRIDALLEQRLESIAREQGISVGVNPEASPRSLVRRAYYDLWGLPPPPEAVVAFERDPSDAAWNALIDSLLASHHYGERWGRHWLDWVRYAETNGYERDGPKPHAWRYRDYVIRSFASDKPYDRFVVEQLAGDQWAQENGWSDTQNIEDWRDAIIATGFYRLHAWDDEPDDADQAEFDEADDVMVTLGTAFLGLTIGCARCHDHKFDPISQRDYYALLSFTRDIDPYGLPKKGGGGRGTGRIQRFLVSDEKSQAWDTQRQQRIEQLRSLLEQTVDPAVRLGIEGQIVEQQNSVPPFDAALSVNENPSGPKPTFVLHRGDAHEPRDTVSPCTPEIFLKHTDAPKSATMHSAVAQNRLGLARWIASPENPLTARVMVNRLWERHFGRGIVATTDDFGRTGSLPSHPELLDYLASEFVRSGWSVHRMHRILMRSRAYRMASSVPESQAAIAAFDPEVQYFWRQRVRRLDAESIRDSMLQAAGNLGGKHSGPSVFPTLSNEVRDSANPVSLSGWIDSPFEEHNCRSIYLTVKRSLKIPFLETLDFVNSTSPTGVRSVTTTAPQALLLLNDPWVNIQAEGLARRVCDVAKSSGSDRQEVLWRIVYQRSPTPSERAAITNFLSDAVSLDGHRNASTIESEWIRTCHALLNTSEFLYID